MQIHFGSGPGSSLSGPVAVRLTMRAMTLSFGLWRGRASSRPSLRAAARVGIRIKHVERDALVRGLHDAHMLALELARMAATARVRDHVDFLVHVAAIVGHP